MSEEERGEASPQLQERICGLTFVIKKNSHAKVRLINRPKTPICKSLNQMFFLVVRVDWHSENVHHPNDARLRHLKNSIIFAERKITWLGNLSIKNRLRDRFTNSKSKQDT